MVEKNVETESVAKGDFSLIDLIMLIMVVGVIMIITIPLKQTKKNELQVRSSLIGMNKLIKANDLYRIDNWDENAWEISHLGIKDLDTSIFTFAIDDTCIVATSTKLAKNDKSYYYHTSDKRFRVQLGSEDIILNAWLP
jgi:competence protein ComGC